MGLIDDHRLPGPPIPVFHERRVELLVELTGRIVGNVEEGDSIPVSRVAVRAYTRIPTFTQTTEYSPEQQAIYDQTQAAEYNLASMANNQSAMLNDLLGPGERIADTWVWRVST